MRFCRRGGRMRYAPTPVRPNIPANCMALSFTSGRMRYASTVFCVVIGCDGVNHFRKDGFKLMEFRNFAVSNPSDVSKVLAT